MTLGENVLSSGYDAIAHESGEKCVTVSDGTSRGPNMADCESDQERHDGDHPQLHWSPKVASNETCTYPLVHEG